MKKEEEKERINLKNVKPAGWSRAEKATEKTKTQSVPASPAKNEKPIKIRGLPSSLLNLHCSLLSNTLFSPHIYFQHTSTQYTRVQHHFSQYSSFQHLSSQNPRHSTSKKKKQYPGEWESCQLDRQALERDLSSQKRALLRPLFKTSSVDSRPAEDPRNFPKDAGVITWMCNTGRDLKVRNHLSEARDAFPEIRIVEMGTPDF